VRIVERLRLVLGGDDQVDQHARRRAVLASLAVASRLQAAERPRLQPHPIGSLRCGRADANEDIALADRRLDRVRQIVAGLHAPRIEPVIHTPDVQRRQQRRAARVIVVRVADEDLAIPAHATPPPDRPIVHPLDTLHAARRISA